jgi:hypothetical protein
MILTEEMCLAFMFMEIGTLTIREEGQGITRKEGQTHNNQPKQQREDSGVNLADVCY